MSFENDMQFYLFVCLFIYLAVFGQITEMSDREIFLKDKSHAPCERDIL